MENIVRSRAPSLVSNTPYAILAPSTWSSGLSSFRSMPPTSFAAFAHAPSAKTDPTQLARIARNAIEFTDISPSCG
jgi:hypothetical protein